MRKFNFKKILCGLLLSVFALSISVSCDRKEDELKSKSKSPETKKEICTDEKAINNGKESPCEYEKPNPEPNPKPNPEAFPVKVSVTDTEFSDGSSAGVLENGTKYRTVVYKEDGSYFSHKDFVVGDISEQNISFEKEDKEKYTIVIYSFNSKELPQITDSEKVNISTSVLDFNINQGQLMYAKVENYQPIKDGNIEVKLRHKFSLFTLIIDNSNTLSDFYKIEKVEYAKISNNQKGKIFLSSGNVTERTEPTDQNLVFLENMFTLGKKSNSEVVWLNVDNESTVKLTYKLKSDLYSKVGSYFANNEEQERAKELDDKEVSKSFSVIQGNKYEQVITKQKCGAWKSDTEFMEFMCQNLGANSSSFDFAVNLGQQQIEKDKHTGVTVDAIGAKYQWGKKDPFFTSELEKQFDEGSFTWLEFQKDKDLSPAPDLDWRGDYKMVSDPCPNGYRLPRVNEIYDLYEYNKANISDISERSISIFQGSYNVKDSEDYSSITGIGLGYFLLLQSNGSRKSYGDLNSEMGYVNIAVSAEPVHTGEYVRALKIGGEKIQFIEKGRDQYIYYFGLTVRCVKE